MVGTLIRQRRRAMGWSQEVLAEKVGWPQNYLSRVENGKVGVPQRATLERLAELLGVSLPEFYRAAGMLEGLDESGEDALSAPTAPPSLQPLMPIAIPVYDAPISAGKGVAALQQYIYLPPDIDIRSDWYGLPVQGDCMFPLLLSGDTVIISPRATAEPGDMVVVDMDEEKGLVKWLREKKGVLWLVPEKGEAILFDEEHIRIVGVVMRMWRNVRRPRKGMWSE